MDRQSRMGHLRKYRWHGCSGIIPAKVSWKTARFLSSRTSIPKSDFPRRPGNVGEHQGCGHCHQIRSERRRCSFHRLAEVPDGTTARRPFSTPGSRIKASGRRPASQITNSWKFVRCSQSMWLQAESGQCAGCWRALWNTVEKLLPSCRRKPPIFAGACATPWTGRDSGPFDRITDQRISRRPADRLVITPRAFRRHAELHRQAPI